MWVWLDALEVANQPFSGGGIIIAVNFSKQKNGANFDAKSCRILLRTVEPTEGSVTIDGVDIQQVGLARLRSSVTAIPQDGICWENGIKIDTPPKINMEPGNDGFQ